ncbi:MAG: hypothetical protein U0Z44_18730 [Kouleothrix sp.]
MLQAHSRLGLRRLGRHDILGAVAGLHLRQRALGAVARGLGLHHLCVELLWVCERGLGVGIRLGRTIARGLGLRQLGLRGGEITRGVCRP